MLPLYDTNIEGHGRDHIVTVILRSFEIMSEFKLTLNPKIVLITAVYHDIEYKKDSDNHEQVSSEMFLADKHADKNSSIEQIILEFTSFQDTIMFHKRGRFGLEKVQNFEIHVKVVLDMECKNI